MLQGAFKLTSKKTEILCKKYEGLFRFSKGLPYENCFRAFLAICLQGFILFSKKSEKVCKKYEELSRLSMGLTL